MTGPSEPGGGSRRPSELADDERRGTSLRLEADGTYTPQQGFVRCARCGMIPDSLYGARGASVCRRCASLIVIEWGRAHVARERRALGMDEPVVSVRPSPVRWAWMDRPIDSDLFCFCCYLCGVVFGVLVAAKVIGRALP